MSAEITIRPFADDDVPQVRALFITVNRLLSPPDLRDAFEAYIERALAEEIDRISAYYGQRTAVSGWQSKTISWSAHSVWSAPRPTLWSCGECMLILVLDGAESLDRCFASPKMNAASGKFAS